MQRLHRWVRGRLWWVAFLIGAALIIGLFTGSFQSGWDFLEWLAIGVTAIAMIINVVDGWFEWRARRAREEDP